MKVQRKLTIIIVMVLLTVVALGTSTYAWFTLNNIAKVDQIEMGITSGVGIDLSLDENADWTQKVWKSKLENSDFNKYIKDVSFDAVTSTDGKEFSLIEANNKVTKADNKFIELKVYFRASNVVNFADTKQAGIYLVENNKGASYSDDHSSLGSGTAIVSKGIDWKADVTFKYSDTETLNPGDTKQCYAKDAVRLSFTYTNGTETSKIFDLSTDSTVGATTDYRGYNYQYGAADYYAVKKGLKIAPVVEEQIVIFNDQLSSINEKAEASSNESLVSVLTKTGDYYYGETTLRIWIEGWDGDCFDSILSDTIQAQLKFQFGIYNK